MTTSRPHAALDEVAGAVEGIVGRRGAEDTGPAATGEDLVQALATLHELRAQLQAWEPALIQAARERGVSWARLAPALGVGTRQAAERRYLRLRPSAEQGMTRDERVQATRDERAGDRAVAAWAREHAAELRRIAGQVSSLSGLTRAGRGRARTLASSLTEDDPVSVLGPLEEMRSDLLTEHPALAEQIDALGRQVRRVRRETQRRRGGAAQS